MGIHRLNHAVLYVADLARSVAFYRDVLGFRPVPMTPEGFTGAAFLQASGSTNDHDLGLFQVGHAAPSAAGHGTVGLYHLAWEVDTLDEFRVEDGALRFVNLSERYGFVEAESSYEIQWFAFDNETGSRRELSAKQTEQGAGSTLPAAPIGESFLLAEIRTRNAENPHWATSVGVYLRPDSRGYSVVGVERESPESNTFPMN